MGQRAKHEAPRLALVLIGIHLLSGCSSNPEGIQQLTNAANIATGAISIANAVQGRSAPANVPAVAGAAQAAAQAAAPMATGNGYSQRGAFEDCERMYKAANRPDLAAECARRANNMGSLTPAVQR